MNLAESIYTIKAADSYAKRAVQFGDFLETVLGLTIKDDYAYDNTTGTIYWLDDKKAVGFAAVWTTYINDKYVGIVPYYAGRKIYYNGSSDYTDGLTSNFALETPIYFQVSKNGDVIYFRIGAEKNCKMLAAKDASGDWCIFQSEKMYHKNGLVNVTCGAVVANNSLFTAAKMPVIVADTSFTELYKMISATSFLEANTYVNFGGKPFKVVSTGGTNILPCFAFPVE